MAVLDPSLYPWLNTGTGGAGVPYLEGTPGAGGIPNQPNQAPIGTPPSGGYFGGIRDFLQGGRGPMQGPAPDFESVGSTILPFLGQDQNVPYFPPPPRPTGGTTIPEIATQTSGPLAKEPGNGDGGGRKSSGLADALRGVKAPAPPQAQTVRTPPPPQIAPIRGGEFVSMLSSLGITPQEFIKMKMLGR